MSTPSSGSEAEKKEREILRKTDHWIEHMKPMLCMENWDVVLFRGDQKEMDKGADFTQALEEGFGSMAIANPDYKYQRLHITLGDLYMGDNVEDDVRQECILHEMCHIFTQPITDIIEWQEKRKDKSEPLSVQHINFVNEMVTEHIAKCFKKVLTERAIKREAKKKAPK